MTINSKNNPMLKLVEDALYLYKFNIKIENVFPSDHHHDIPIRWTREHIQSYDQ